MRIFMPAQPTQNTAARLARSLLAAALALAVGATSAQAGRLPAAAARPAGDTEVLNSSVEAVTTKLYLPMVAGRSGSGAADTEARIYWGALVDGAAPSPTNLQNGGVFSNFETSVNKRMAILHWGQPWEMKGAMQPFQMPRCVPADRSPTGITWMPTCSGLSVVVAGSTAELR